jgi:hypothetical protein
MFQGEGLSLDQAPPIKIIINFFIMASLFGVAGGVGLALLGDSILDASMPTTIVLTHIFTIGVMTSFIIGALFQMSPVLAGVAIKYSSKASQIFQALIILGLMFFIGDFIWNLSGNSFAGVKIFVLFMMLIGFFFFYFLEPISKREMQNMSIPARGMSYSMANLVFTVTVAYELITILSGNPLFTTDIDYQIIKTLHIEFGLVGLGVTLITVVSFSVVEMFYVTSSIPKHLRLDMPFAMTIILIFKGSFLVLSSNGDTVLGIDKIELYANIFYIFDIFLGLIVLLYACLILALLFSQKRKVIEATILFWRVGIGSLIIFSLFFIIYSVVKIPFFNISWDGSNLLIIWMMISFFFFISSIIFAMVYKIIPFLVWFHLNAKGYLSAPLMHEVISPKYSKAHFYLHLIVIFVALCSIFFSNLWQFVGLLLAISFGILFWAIFRANQKYKYVKRSTKPFKMNIE